MVLKAIDSILLSEKIEIEIILITSDKDFSAPSKWKEKVIVKVVDNVPPYNLPAYKRNFGALIAKYDYIAYFDDDVEIFPNTIFELYQSIKPSQIGMVFGKLLNMEYPYIFDEAGGFLTWNGFIWARGDRKVDIGQFNTTEPIFAGKSASCMVRKELVNFDESMGILGEESDLAWRIWLQGYKVMYAPQSVTYHAFNTKFKPVDFYTADRVFYNGCRNYITMLFKNLSFINLIWMLPVHVMCWIIAGFMQAINKRWTASKLIFKGIGYCFSNFKKLCKKRGEVQKLRKVSDIYIFSLVSKSPPISYYLTRLFRYGKTGVHG